MGTGSKGFSMGGLPPEELPSINRELEKQQREAQMAKQRRVRTGKTEREREKRRARQREE